jgi:hypothetical protein
MFDLKAIVAGRTLWLGEPDLDVSRAKGHDQTKKGLILGCIESLPSLEFGRRLRLVVLTGILRTRPTSSLPATGTDNIVPPSGAGGSYRIFSLPQQASGRRQPRACPPVKA